MKPLFAGLASGLITALLALAITSTLFGNRGDGSASWTGGSAPLLAFGAGLLPMSLVHLLSFCCLRRADALPLRMARAVGLGLLAFGLAVAGLVLLARDS